MYSCVLTGYPLAHLKFNYVRQNYNCMLGNEGIFGGNSEESIKHHRGREND